MYFSMILPPYTFCFATVFLLFLGTASILCLPNATFPSWYSPSFGGWLGCFGHFLGSGGSTYEQNYVGLQGIKIKHRKKTPEKLQYHFSNPWSNSYPVLLFMSWSSL